MNKHAFAALLLLLTMGVEGCISSPGGGQSDALGVVVSIPPYAEWVERIGGEYVDVTILVPEGASPHTYEVTPHQMVKVSKASLWVKNGVGLEHWADKIVETNDGIAVVDISSAVELIGDGSGDSAYDAHVWLSLNTARDGAFMIAQELSKLDPAHAQEYAENRDAYIAQIDMLDESIRAAVGATGARTFLVFHPAWSYFARDYSLEQVAIEDKGKEPGPEYLGSVVETARELGITVVFIEPQFSADDAKVIAEEIGGSVVSINPLAEAYLENMQAVADTIVEGLA